MPGELARESTPKTCISTPGTTTSVCYKYAASAHALVYAHARHGQPFGPEPAIWLLYV